jgi:hypothetical protein
MTTARDVIAEILCRAAGPECDCGDSPCVYYRTADGLLASDSVRQELAALLNPWRPINLADPDVKLMHENLWAIHERKALGLRVSAEHYLFLTRRPSFGFDEAMAVCERGFKAWAAKEHNHKWFKRIDGTPIPNDLMVNIAEVMMQLPLPAPPSED